MHRGQTGSIGVALWCEAKLLSCNGLATLSMPGSGLKSATGFMLMYLVRNQGLSARDLPDVVPAAALIEGAAWLATPLSSGQP